MKRLASIPSEAVAELRLDICFPGQQGMKRKKYSIFHSQTNIVSPKLHNQQCNLCLIRKKAVNRKNDSGSLRAENLDAAHSSIVRDESVSEL